MKKFALILCMLITLAVTAGLIFIMVTGINGDSGSWFNIKWFNDRNIKIGMNFGGNDVLIKEERIPAEGLEIFALSTSSYSVQIRATDGDSIVVRQYAPDGSDDQMTVTRNGGECRVDIGHESSFYIGIFLGDWRAEVDIPRGWAGNVDIKTISGGVKIFDEFTWNDVRLKTTSGGVTASNGMNAANLSIDLASGGINMGEVKAETFDIHTISGGVKFAGLTGAGNIKCTSGGVKLNRFTPTGDSTVKTTSGGVTVLIPDSVSFKLDARTTSGGIKTDFGHTFDSERKNHATASNGSEPFVTLDVDVMSGGVHINKY
ncbi:hypothetical protein FACS1894202_04770 [Clostridia bacterium]|nr:hypothetical protein FACS1894202_04770 [Clostridia bacterium]